jgi:hypothetical protein
VFVQSFPLYVKLSKSNSREGPGWLNEVGRWIYQLIQAYRQYGVGSLPALLITKRCTRLAAASDKVYQLFADVGGSLQVLRLPPPLKQVAII